MGGKNQTQEFYHIGTDTAPKYPGGGGGNSSGEYFKNPISEISWRSGIFTQTIYFYLFTSTQISPFSTHYRLHLNNLFKLYKNRQEREEYRRPCTIQIERKETMYIEPRNLLVVYQNKKNYWTEEQKHELKNDNICKYNIEAEK